MVKSQENEDGAELTNYHKSEVSTLRPNRSNSGQNQRTSINSYKGILMSFVSGVLISFSGLIYQLIPLHPGQLLLFRQFGTAVVTLPFIILTQKRVYLGKKNLALSGFYGVLSGISSLARIDAVQRLPISDTTVILFATPVFVAAFARCCIKDRCGFALICSLIPTFVGLVLVVKPATLLKGHHDWSYDLGICSAFIAVLTGALVQMMLATKMKVYHTTVLMFHSAFIVSVLTVIIGFSFGKLNVPTLGQTGMMFIQLFLSLPINALSIKALHYEIAAISSVFKSIATILTAFLIQIILFHGSGIDAFSISGAVLVFAGAVVLSLRTYLLILPENSPMRKYVRI